jgi:phage shock protein A
MEATNVTNSSETLEQLEATMRSTTRQIEEFEDQLQVNPQDQYAFNRLKSLWSTFASLEAEYLQRKAEQK